MITVGEKLAVEFRIDVVASGAKPSVASADLLTRRTIVSVYMQQTEDVRS